MERGRRFECRMARTCGRKLIETCGLYNPDASVYDREAKQKRFALLDGKWRLVRLEDQLGRPVELRGRARSLNGVWWFYYRGTDLYVEKMADLPGWTSDNHWRPIIIRGILDKAQLPRLDQVSLKPDQEPQGVLRRAKGFLGAVARTTWDRATDRKWRVANASRPAAWESSRRVSRELSSGEPHHRRIPLRTAKGITGGFSHPSPCPLPDGERVQRTVIPFVVLIRPIPGHRTPAPVVCFPVRRVLSHRREPMKGGPGPIADTRYVLVLL